MLGKHNSSWPGVFTSILIRQLGGETWWCYIRCGTGHVLNLHSFRILETDWRKRGISEAIQVKRVNVQFLNVYLIQV